MKARPAAEQAELPFYGGLSPARGPDQRARLVEDWLSLVRVVLPGLSRKHGWPISQDHCFMRVCLDTVFGGPWHVHVQRPAIRHLSLDQLKAAISVAEAVAQAPETLDALNRQSIAWRQEPMGAQAGDLMRRVVTRDEFVPLATPDMLAAMMRRPE